MLSPIATASVIAARASHISPPFRAYKLTRACYCRSRYLGARSGPLKARFLFRFQNDPRSLAHLQVRIRIDEQRLLERRFADQEVLHTRAITSSFGPCIFTILKGNLSTTRECQGYSSLQRIFRKPLSNVIFELHEYARS